MASIFFIGATGHIGAAVVDKLLSGFPDASITALFRTHEQAGVYRKSFPAVQPVIGDLDSLELIEKESSGADVVINAAPDTYPSVTDAIGRGLAARGASKPSFYIHTSGAALIWELPGGDAASPKVWDDVADIEQIRNRPEGTTHRDTDARARALHDEDKGIRVAIVSPSYVYGISPSPTRPTFLTLPDVVATMRAVGAGFVVGRGLNRETFVHVRDLAEMYAALVNDARRQVRGGARDGESLWGLDAYYFGGDEELSFREFMETLLPLARARGIVSRDDIVSLGAGEPATLLSGSDAKGGTGGDQDRGAGRVEHEWSDHILVMFGINMRCRSVRARKLLGYVPRGESVAESLPATLDLFLRRAKAT